MARRKQTASDTLPSGVMDQLAQLQAEIGTLRQENAVLRRRLDSVADIGREQALLDRLDLFYLLLSERLDRAQGVAPAAEGAAPATRSYRPAEIDGVGLHDLEGDGTQEWRWFGPEATLALRDVPRPVGHAVLYFHAFAGGDDPPGVRVSTGGPAQEGTWRAMEARYALRVPPPPSGHVHAGMLIVRLSFDRHTTSAEDPRLLSAVFSGAEIMSRPD